MIGNRPLRSATATRKTDARWNCRRSSTSCLGSPPPARAPPVARGILGAGAGHPAAKLRGELLARRDRIDQTLVEQLVEQQWKRGDLLRQETGLRAEIDHASERERVLG